MADFTMPTLGADMDEGTLLEWRVAVGDHVARGDIVALVDTEKSTIEVEIFESGVIEELMVAPGTTVAVGTPLARVRSDASTPTAAPVVPASPTAVAEVSPVTPAAPVHPAPNVLSPLVRHLAVEEHVDLDHVAGTGVGHRVTRDDVERAASARLRVPGGSSPWARRRAQDLHVDLTTLTGSGPGGAVRARDVEAAPPASPATQGAPAAPRSGAERQASMRRAIARLMTEANRDIPHYHLSSTIDIDRAVGWLEERNADRPTAERILPAALLLRATALAAARHRELNGHWIDDEFRPAAGVDLGVAIALRGGGLVAPVIRDADRRSLEETMTALKDLVTRARQGSLRGSEVGGASITVTNLGDRGAEAVFGVIHPPQVALVGFGRITSRPCAVGGTVVVHPTVTASLSGDHRATDGHVGSRLLETVGDLLGRPAEL